ncbi:FAD-binding oxidoreductase [Xanthovirga aplysinae]|uniref:FAD-binding oxidoreductase n=1 Tax=Xanthovirga aplysinae TaxID=2529853 RepID=UPI0012BC95CB|nr:FAD-binding oxidoreductase [Xanthovirga aplysinae]MTI31280.1 FAD-binding oxidoreductase [Xanthovirga aplysinae]
MKNQKPKWENWQEYLLTEYRGWISTIFLLPLSVLFSIYFKWKQKWPVNPSKTWLKHEKGINSIKEQLRQWREDGAKEKLCTGRSPWKTMSELIPDKDRYRKINIDMDNILEIDEDRQVVKVEPLVTMGQITAALKGRGWTLTLVPELDDLTVGGLLMGFGVESSSHRYGLFQHICKSFSILTPDGELRHATPNENRDLYYLVPWSHGTLGFLVAAELKIIPSNRFVRLEYQATFSPDQLVSVFESASQEKEKHHFVETLVFSKDKAVVMKGNLVDRPQKDGILNKIGRWHKPWFFKHVESYLEKGNGIEYIPLRQYYHRHTRSYFWEMREIIPFGNNPWFRWLLGWAMPPHIQLLKRLQSETIRKLRERFHVVQDMIVPICFLKDSLEYLAKHYSLYPLWLCPLLIKDNESGTGFIYPYQSDKGNREELPFGTNSQSILKKENRNNEGHLDRSLPEELFVDIGIYGTPMVKSFEGNRELKNLEHFVIEHHGFQALYARTLLSEKQFRQMFDHKDYDRIRQELPYVKEAFEEVYTKLTKGRIQPDKKRKKVKQKAL